MTEEKAMIFLEDDCFEMNRQCDCQYKTCDDCYIKMAMDAIKKQTPMKPKSDHCPRCGLIIYGRGDFPNYCDECGQKLDWSDET